PRRPAASRCRAPTGRPATCPCAGGASARRQCPAPPGGAAAPGRGPCKGARGEYYPDKKEPHAKAQSRKEEKTEAGRERRETSAVWVLFFSLSWSSLRLGAFA